MKKICLWLLALGSVATLAAGADVKMRIFEGVKDVAGGTPDTVTSSFLKYVLSATLESEADLAAEQLQIRRIFKLGDVRLLTESDYKWTPGNSAKISHVFRLGAREYKVFLTPSGAAGDQRFRIEVLEPAGSGAGAGAAGRPASLLDTEFSAPRTSATVFGFEDTRGKPYFISLRTIRSDEVEPVRLIEKVDPIYPETAKKAKVEGVVVLEGNADIRGRVASVKVLRSVPLLDQAAVDALRQWVYEPLVIEGKPRPFVFTVTMRFRLDSGKGAVSSRQGVEGGVEGGVKGGVAGGVGGGVIGGVEGGTPGSAPTPKLVKHVEPAYPETARKNNVEGAVILEGTADIYGRIANVKVLRSVPLLDQAAIDALRQWVYEPMVIDGKPRPFVFTVTMKFRLVDGKGEVGFDQGGVIGGVEGGVAGGVVGGAAPTGRAKTEEGVLRAVGGVKPPKLVKSVEPVYPETARKAHVEGTVILEATTDKEGNVVNVKVLRSIPVLDQAAVDALKQWKYAPMLIDGKPQGIVFTVTVRFRLTTGDREKDLVKFAQGAVKCEGDIAPPKLVGSVDPVYPPEARQAGVQGVVILSVRTDAEGKVVDVMILRSIPMLNQAAIDAVRQWRYEPLIVNGAATPAVFTVTVRFKLE
jgi:TonB family protein